jgi:hypothetical protein
LPAWFGGGDATAPDFVPWDPLTPLRSERGPWNGGCPPGYVCQFVAPGTEGATDYGNPSSWARCRRIETWTPAANLEETGVSWGETMNAVTGAIADTAGQVYESARTAVASLGGFAPLVLAVVGLYFVDRILGGRR